ncbi:hypothetical protein CTA2_10908 [Colletotrichum tanaceti]|nr:hypothetical protein CTA2_10908 [Colletotrichum tanaceti]
MRQARAGVNAGNPGVLVRVGPRHPRAETRDSGLGLRRPRPRPVFRHRDTARPSARGEAETQAQSNRLRPAVDLRPPRAADGHPRPRAPGPLRGAEPGPAHRRPWARLRAPLQPLLEAPPLLGHHAAPVLPHRGPRAAAPLRPGQHQHRLPPEPQRRRAVQGGDGRGRRGARGQDQRLPPRGGLHRRQGDLGEHLARQAREGHQEGGVPVRLAGRGGEHGRCRQAGGRGRWR